MSRKARTVDVGNVPAFVSDASPSASGTGDGGGGGGNNRLQNALAITGGAIAVFYLARSYYYEHFYKAAHNQTLKPEPASRRIFVVNSSESFINSLNAITGTFSGVVDYVPTTLTLYTDSESTGVQRLKKDLLAAFDMLEKQPCIMEASFVQINGEDPDIFMSPVDLVRTCGGAKMSVRHVIAMTVDGKNIKMFDVENAGKVVSTVPQPEEKLVGFETKAQEIHSPLDVFCPNKETYAPSSLAVERKSGLEFDSVLKGFDEGSWQGLKTSDGGLHLLLAPVAETIRRLSVHFRYAHQVVEESKFLQLLPPAVAKALKVDGHVTANSHITAPFEVVICCSVRSKASYKQLLEIAKSLKMKTNATDDVVGYPSQLFLTFESALMAVHVCHQSAFDAARVLAVRGYEVERIRVKAVLGDGVTTAVDHKRPFFIHHEKKEEADGRVTRPFLGLVPVTDEDILTTGIVGQMQFFEFTIRATICDENFEDVCSVLSAYDAYVSRNKFGSVAPSMDDVTAAPKKERVHLIVFRSCGVGWHSAASRFEKLRVACEVDDRINTSDVQSAFIIYDSDLVADKGLCPVEDGSDSGDTPLEMTVSFFPEQHVGEDKRYSF